MSVRTGYDRKVPGGELADRLRRFCGAMDGAHPDWEMCVISGSVNMYYFTGTIQDGALIIERDKGAVFWVRRSYERALAESAFGDIRRMNGFRDAAGAYSRIPDTVYLDMSEATMQWYGLFTKYFPFRKALPADAVLQRVRSVKSPYEADILRRAGGLADRLLREEVPALLRDGMTEAELGADILALFIKNGHHGVHRFSARNNETLLGHIGFSESPLTPSMFNSASGLAGLYPAAPVLGSRNAALERGEKDELALWEWFREESLKEFTTVYDMMGVRFDSFDGESFFSDKMDRVMDELGRLGLLETSDGAQIVDLDDFGLGKALIRKSDGSTLYITRDVAAAIYRKEHYGFYKNIYVVASQQDLHFKQWIKILELMGYGWAADCVHVPFGLVRLADGAMSTRTGNVVFLEDVLGQAVSKTKDIIAEKGVVTGDADETARQIGIGAVVFQDLHNNRIKDYVFSWDETLNFDGGTGPYSQYGHARAASVLRKAGEAGIDTRPEALLSAADFSAAGSGSAFALAKLIGALPDAIAEAGEKYEPSLITRHITYE